MKINQYIKTASRFLLIPIALFFIFQNSIERFLNFILVDPLLSNCNPPSLRYDVSALVLLIIVLFPILRKMIASGARLPTSWYFVSLLYLVLYSYYRFYDHKFWFTSLKLIPQMALMDIVCLIIVIPVFASLIISISGAMKKKHTLSPKAAEPAENSAALEKKKVCPFRVDEPARIQSEDDPLTRNKFTDNLVETIQSTKTPNGSFPIAIVAPWGSGKTTFIESVVDKLDKKDNIIINFNIWNCSSPEKIIDSFFSLLREELSPFSFALNNKIQEYANNLIKNVDNNNLNSLSNAAEIIWPHHSLEQQYGIINEEIKKIDKRIVILIDDLDRLDRKEIYEVIRLIRNTANFSNTFFIVAYDRSYILNAIEEINLHRPHYFLEKIFQLEFGIPTIPKSTIERELNKLLFPILTEKDQRVYLEFLKEKTEHEGIALFNLTHLFIHNLRDVTRFYNSFLLHYQYLKNEVYFPDFFNLQLIRFKHPELFLLFHENLSNLLIPQELAGNKKVILKVKSSNENNSVYNLLRSNQGSYKFSSDDISKLTRAMESIFPSSAQRLSSYYELEDADLTVTKPIMLERYFSFGIEGMISSVEFSKLRAGAIEDFESKIVSWIAVPALISDIQDKLVSIKFFDSKEDYENILRIILFLANQKNADKSTQQYLRFIGFDGQSLSNTFFKSGNDTFYKSRTEYRAYIYSLLRFPSQEYSYQQDFLSYLLRHNYQTDPSILSNDEISDMLLENFSYAIARAEKFSIGLWSLFIRCEILDERQLNQTTKKLKYHPNPIAAEKMASFIFKKDLDGFLQFTVVKAPFDNAYHIQTENIIKVFGNTDHFYQSLKKFKGISMYRYEFLSLASTLEESETLKKEGGVPASFFQQIPIIKD
jgi:hypothetical protein